MKKYQINVHYDAVVTVPDILAETEEEAIKIAEERASTESLNTAEVVGSESCVTRTEEVEIPSKKAFLVNFGFATRVVADASASNDTIARLAVEKIINNMLEDGIGTYVCIDNIGEIEEDTELPFGEMEEDKNELLS